MIQTNPFYLMNIPMSASKGVIAAAAEVMQLGGGQFDGDEMMNMLLSPDARTEAEVSWFPGEEEKTVQDIRNAVRTSSLIEVKGLSTLSILNAKIYNFGIELVSADSRDLAGLFADRIWEIAECAGGISAAEVLQAINSERNAAGIIPAAENRVREALDMRSKEICEEIDSLLTNSISEEMHRAIVCGLAADIISRGDMSIRTVINDIIDKYAVGHMAEIQELEEKIRELGDRITACSPGNLPGVNLLYGQLKTAAARWADVSEPMLIRADKMDLFYAEGTGVRDAVNDAVFSVANDKTFDSHYGKAISMCRDMGYIFAANRRLAEPFGKAAREEDEERRERQDEIKRGGCFRAFLGFFAATGLFYTLVIIGILLDSDTPQSEKTGYAIFGIGCALLFIIPAWQIIKSFKRQREYEQGQSGKNQKNDR